MQDSFTCLDSLKTTFTEMTIGVTKFQHYYLELYGCLDYIRIYKPCMDGARLLAESIMNSMGAITNILCIVQDFYTAGLPVCVRGHPVSHDNWLHIKTFQSTHPCSDDAIVTSHNRPHIKTLQSAPFCHDNGVVTSHNRPPIKAFRSTGPYIPPHHHPTFASHVRPCIETFQSMGPHTPS